MFTGAINADLRSIVGEWGRKWAGRDVYVPCSGNFTIERILRSVGVDRLHGNDVSLYSCVVGGHLSGKEVSVHVKDERYSWIEDYLSPGIDTISALLLCTKYFQFVERSAVYYRRMSEAYEREWERLHKATVERVSNALEGHCLESFFAGDAFDFLESVPENGVVISFPPTYAGGYERLYKKIDSVFEWESPKYVVFDGQRFNDFVERVMGRESWMISRDEEIPGMEEFLAGRVQTGQRSKAVFVYAGDKGSPRLSLPRQKIEPFPCRRLSGDIAGPMTLAEMTQGQFNMIRSEYLSVKIIPSSAKVRLAVLCGGVLVGCMAFDRESFYPSGAYMMTDFAIRPTKYKRLSKLVLAAAISSETREYLEQSFGCRIDRIVTTAFTDNAVSMKYRGLFDVMNRKEGLVNYVAPAAKWSLGEGFSWWMEKCAKSLKD
jgi:hypothetical protein